MGLVSKEAMLRIWRVAIAASEESGPVDVL